MFFVEELSRLTSRVNSSPSKFIDTAQLCPIADKHHELHEKRMVDGAEGEYFGRDGMS